MKWNYILNKSLNINIVQWHIPIRTLVKCTDIIGKNVSLHQYRNKTRREKK